MAVGDELVDVSDPGRRDSARARRLERHLDLAQGGVERRQLVRQTLDLHGSLADGVDELGESGEEVECESRAGPIEAAMASGSMVVWTGT